MMYRDFLFKNIIENNTGKKLYCFSNADEKYWIIPDKNVQTALGLYQPSSLRGKVVVKLLPVFKNLSFFRKLIGAQKLHGALTADLYNILRDIFDRPHIEFSVFGGTPSVHQKVTIQIFDHQKILGYCKITESEEIKKIFYREKDILQKLKGRGVTHIPDCLSVDSYREKYTFFIQSTKKTCNSTIEHTFRQQHWEFLLELYSKTKVSIQFVQSEFHASLSRLLSNSSYLGGIQQALLLKKTEEISFFYGNTIAEFSACHADFTPWNMYFEKGELYVFDFEYAKMTYPPFLDWYHFFTQVCIFKHKDSAKKIRQKFEKENKTLSKYIEDPVLLYKCYLLDIISFYFERDKGTFGKDVANNLRIWTELLEIL